MPNVSILYFVVLYVISFVTNVKFKTFCFIDSILDGSAVAEEPEFTSIIDNVTVPAGRNVKMACSVKNLGSFKVIKKYFLFLCPF